MLLLQNELLFDVKDIPSGHVHEFQVIRPNQPTMTYKIRLGDEPLLAPVVSHLF